MGGGTWLGSRTNMVCRYTNLLVQKWPMVWPRTTLCRPKKSLFTSFPRDNIFRQGKEFAPVPDQDEILALV